MTTTTKLHTEADDLLSVTCMPPQGMRFTAGIWLTHDVDTSTVTEFIIPLLMDIEPCPGDFETRKKSRAALQSTGAQLAIVHAADRRNIKATPDCGVSFYPVTGRRQHAKVALLLFEAEEPGTLCVRALVSSANLTGSGVTRNREVFVLEESSGDKRRLTIAADILQEIRALGDSGDIVGGTQLIELADIFADKVSKPKGSIRSSIGDKQPLLASFEGEAVKLIIVSPPFASPHDATTGELFLPLLSKEATVEVYTHSDGSDQEALSASTAPQFSPAVLKSLASGARSVTLFGVPSVVTIENDGEPIEITRNLHAKLYALIYPQRGRQNLAKVLIGSANCTRPGLGGINRELLVEVAVEESELQEFLKSLCAKKWEGETSSSATDEVMLDSTIIPPRPDIRAVFSPYATASPNKRRWPGVLEVTAEDTELQRIEYHHKKIWPPRGDSAATSAPKKITTEQEVIVRFKPEDTVKVLQPRWPGQLSIESPGRAVESIHYRGQSIALEDLDNFEYMVNEHKVEVKLAGGEPFKATIEILTEEPAEGETQEAIQIRLNLRENDKKLLVITHSGEVHEVLIEVMAHDTFFTDADLQDTEHPTKIPKDLRMLLDILNLSSDKSRSDTLIDGEPEPESGPAERPIAFHMPLHQRLVVIARHRKMVKKHLREDDDLRSRVLEEVIMEGRAEEPTARAELAVARTLIGLTPDVDAADRELLDALKLALEEGSDEAR